MATKYDVTSEIPKVFRGTAEGKFLAYWMRNEASAGPNLKAYKSKEGGNGTIGYGHKIRDGEDFSKGITKEQAFEILQLDMSQALQRTRQHVDNQYGVGSLDKLPTMRQFALMEVSMNSKGGLMGYPNMVDAVMAGDMARAKKESTRTYTDTSGKVIPLTNRMNDFRDTFLGNY